jgi:hypothetical protein
MNLTILDQIFQKAQKSSASGRGASYWSTATMCGYKRQVLDQQAALEEDTDDSNEGAHVGTLFHALMDAYFKGHIPEGDVIDASSIQDTEWAEAVRLFLFAKEHFPRARFSTVVGSEIKLPINEAKRDAFFGHNEATGAMDLLAHFSQADCDWWNNEFPGLGLRPGLWVFDWKTAAQRCSVDAAPGKYTDTIQSKMYPTLWNLEGGEPVLGTVYLVFVKHKELKRYDQGPKALASVQAFSSHFHPNMMWQVKEAVQYAREQRDSGRKAMFESACYQGGKPCIALRKGWCTR